MSVKLYYNPRCSKSRQTLSLLQKKGIQPEIIEYLKNPPTADEIRKVLNLLNLSPRQLIRKGELIYKELSLEDPTLTDDELIGAIIENPILIERPIVLANKKAALGRRPESVLKIL